VSHNIRPTTHCQVNLIRSACQVCIPDSVNQVSGRSDRGGFFSRTCQVYLIVCVLIRCQIDLTGGPDQVYLIVNEDIRPFRKPALNMSDIVN
jgi:hypothetical protein